MTLKKLIGMAVISIMIPATSQAQENGSYGSIGAATYDFETYGVDIKLGHNFSENFGIEAHGIVGITTDSQKLCSANCATAEVKTDYTLGLFAVGRLPLSEQLELFARGGVHNTKYSVEINNAANTMFDSNDTGVAVGAGVQYNLNARNAIRLETTYLDNIDSQTSAISFVRKF